MQLVLMIEMHVSPQTVLVAVLAFANRTGHLDTTLVALVVVPAHVHVERVRVLQFFAAVGANAASGGRMLLLLLEVRGGKWPE